MKIGGAKIKIQNKNSIYYWIIGIVILVVVVLLAMFFSWGGLFSGKVTGTETATTDKKIKTTAACIYSYGAWTPTPCTTGTQTRDVSSYTPIPCSGTPVTSRACQITVAPCQNRFTVDLIPEPSAGGNVTGGQVVNLGKWIFKSQTELTIKSLTFSVYQPGSLLNLKLYLDGGAQIGSPAGYDVDATGKIRIADLTQNIPAGGSIVIQAKGIAANPNSRAPVIGDRLELILANIDEAVEGDGKPTSCGLTNNAVNVWGPAYILDAVGLFAEPVVTNMVSSGAGAITPAANTMMLIFGIKAKSEIPTDFISFSNNGAGTPPLAKSKITALTATAANQLTVKLSSSVSAKQSSCSLYGIMPQSQEPVELSRVNTIAAKEQYLQFNFDLNSDFRADTKKQSTLYVQCDTVAMLGGAPGASVTASIPSDARSFEWGINGVFPDVTEKGMSVFPEKMTGYTVMNNL